MSRMQRAKGQTGEREIAALVRDLTWWDVRRRVRQHDGDRDLGAAPGWSVEVKRHRTASRGDVAVWWQQTVEQADEMLPVLFFRADRDSWRAVWPIALLLAMQSADKVPAGWRGYPWTVEGSVDAWAAAARELASQATRHGDHE